MSSHAHPTAKEVVEFATNGELHTSDGGHILLVRRRAPAPLVLKPIAIHARLLGNEPMRIRVPVIMRPWPMDSCHSEAFCHSGAVRTVQMLERYYWCIGVEQCTRRWVRNCFRRESRKTSCKTVRSPTVLLPLPSRPGLLAVSVDSSGPLDITKQW